MQSSQNILLIRPANFGFNAETAISNSFQKNTDEDQITVAKKAIQEFDNFVDTLRAKGISVFIFEDTVQPAKPDAIFPNNWISLHSNGTIVLYPMCTANRRTERRQDIIEGLRQQFKIEKVIDLSRFEQEGKFLEGTGSIVFDHDNKIAYASISPRTSKELFLDLAAQLDYKPLYFHAHDNGGQEIYHTNVIMCIAEKFCVLCLECINDMAERNDLTASLRRTGHEIIEISAGQMNSFAGNMLSVQTGKNEPLLILSQTAYNSLREDQKHSLGRYATLVPIAIPTIESIGGGSVRCMMAEIFLPAKD